MSSPIVLTLAPEFEKPLYKALVEADFEISKPAFTHFVAKKKGLTLSLYISKKLVIQGKDLDPEWLSTLPGVEIEGEKKSKPRGSAHLGLPIIGSDESGKGDFFGPLVVAAVAATEADEKTLASLALRDSKEMSDKEILELAPHIKKLLPHSILILSPPRYNEIYDEMQNLNEILARAHGTAIRELYAKTPIRRVLVDQFAHNGTMKRALAGLENLEFFEETKAESHPVVAAASILARAAFLKELARLGESIEEELPKGAGSPVLQKGSRLVQKYGEEVLAKVAKVHFKTYDQILSRSGPSY